MKRKKKFQRPATGLRGKSKANVVGYAGVRVTKGYVYDKLRYTILTCTRMSDIDRKVVEATLKTINIGPEIITLPDGVNGWSVTELTTIDFNGEAKRAYLVKYKGIEVSLYFKRQLTEIKLQPGDRYPEGVLQDPSEAWQKLDLLGKSSKKANVVLTNVHERLENENKVLSQRIEALNELNATLESKVFKLEEEMGHFTKHAIIAARRRKRKLEKKEGIKYAKQLKRKKEKIAKMLAEKKRRRKKRRSK